MYFPILPIDRRTKFPASRRVARTTNPKMNLGALPSVFEGGAFSSLSLDLAPLEIHGIDLHQSRFVSCVKRKTAPRPILGMLHQPALHRIRVHVVQFFFLLLVAVHIEVVKPRLPELRQVSNELRKGQ